MTTEVREWWNNLTYSPKFTILHVLECDDIASPCILDSSEATERCDEVNEMCWEHDDVPMFHCGYDVVVLVTSKEVQTPSVEDMDFIKEHLEELGKYALTQDYGWYTILNEYYDDLL